MSLRAVLFSPDTLVRAAGRIRIAARLDAWRESAGTQQAQNTSLPDLLKLLLGLGETTMVAVTPSFQSWVGSRSRTIWPPDADAGAMLWLVDTRDAIARRELAAIATAASKPMQCAAAIVLTGTARPGHPLRRLLSGFGGIGQPRVPPDQFERTAAGNQSIVRRLAFEDGPTLPTEFSLRPQNGSTGTAFLIAERPLFVGPLWSLIADRLGSAEIQIDGFQLRIRGAAVVTLHAGGRPFVVRIVPPGPLQAIVSRNHHALVELRALVAGEEQLIRCIPTPIFADHSGTAAVFAETLVPGALAWKVVSGALAKVVYRNTLEFLDRLRAATVRPMGLDRTGLRALTQEERFLADATSFVSMDFRRAFLNELEVASASLEGIALPLYASHGDFGYGNVLVDPSSGAVEGVIDWDTARLLDFPGVDRVNLEIQIRRKHQSLAAAVQSVWRLESAHDALHGESGPRTVRALFGLAVCRYISRSFRYPAVYAREAAGFERVLHWLARTGP